MPLPYESSPSPKHAPITKSDATTYDPPLRALYVGTTGNVVITDSFGNDATYKNVPDGGEIRGLLISKVKSTGTTAADMIGWY